MRVVWHPAISVNSIGVWGGVVPHDIEKPAAQFGGDEEFAAVRAAQGDEEPAFADVIFMAQANIFVTKGHGRFGPGR